jgi:DNA-binding MarR family transcriptional regulator
MDFFERLCVAVRDLEEYGNEGRIVDAQILQYIDVNVVAPYEDLALYLGTSETSVSRMTDRLGDVNRQDKPGYGLLEKMQDPVRKKRKLVRFTPKGIEWIRALKQQG